MIWSRKEKLATSYEELKAQAEVFLVNNGFPLDDLHIRLFAQHVQAIPQEYDFFEPKRVAMSMRKAKANEAAFYVLYPERLPKEPNETEQQEIQRTEDEVV